MPAPGGLLLASVNVRLFILGSERGRGGGLWQDPGRRCLQVVEWTSSRPDNLLTMDHLNHGVIVTRHMLPFTIHSFTLVSKHRFYLFKVYTKVSKHHPEFEYQLFEGNLAVSYQFERRVVAMSVASHGQLVALRL